MNTVSMLFGSILFAAVATGFFGFLSLIGQARPLTWDGWLFVYLLFFWLFLFGATFVQGRQEETYLMFVVRVEPWFERRRQRKIDVETKRKRIEREQNRVYDR